MARPARAPARRSLRPTSVLTSAAQRGAVVDAPTLTARQLNRAVLARQLLLERGSGALGPALQRVGGLQAQYAPSMYVGLWSRLEHFEREQLDGALERREVVQGTLMR